MTGWQSLPSRFSTLSSTTCLCSFLFPCLSFTIHSDFFQERPLSHFTKGKIPILFHSSSTLIKIRQPFLHSAPLFKFLLFQLFLNIFLLTIFFFFFFVTFSIFISIMHLIPSLISIHFFRKQFFQRKSIKPHF